jgi:hypothetical protein
MTELYDETICSLSRGLKGHGFSRAVQGQKNPGL